MNYYLIILLIVAAVATFIIYIEKKCNKIIIRDLVNNRELVTIAKAMEFVDKDKSKWWKIIGEKDVSKRLLPCPPEQAINITKKGKKFVEVYRFESGEVVYISSNVNNFEIPVFIPEQELVDKWNTESDTIKRKGVEDAWRKDKVAKWKKTNKVIEPFQPLTTNQRMAYLSNIKKAESRNKMKLTEQIMQIISVGALVLVIIVGMIMWKDIAQPALEAGKTQENIVKMQTEQLQLLHDIKTNKQTIDTRLEDIKNAKKE